jgi:maltooligosyltrehalose trehalohydrolase
MPFGAEAVDGGVQFSLWAPTAKEVALVIGDRQVAVEEVAEGWRQVVLPDARSGDRYGFRIDGDLVVPDPASRFQPEDVHGLSQIVDPRGYSWSDGWWKGLPWEEAVLYEMHVGTATPEGTYAALAEKLEGLAELGVTAVELMPLSDFPGRRNWGYDGVLPFAPDAAYGTPDELKQLIDRAHALGIMVMLDVVYNHFGPAGNYLNAYAKTFFTDRHKTPWGAGVNVDGSAASVVRDFFIHNALYWLEEFHFDGLRLDAVHEIRDDSETHVLTEMAERIRAELPGREIHLTLENDDNEARRLDRDDRNRPRHYTAQWNDDLHHTWYEVLSGSDEDYYADYDDDPLKHLGRSLAEGFAYQGEPSGYRNNKPRGEPSAHLPPGAFVAFLQNHDQIGNRAFGERISDLVEPDRLKLARAALLLGPNPPMMFMGEDWAASTPFLYFVDFDGDPELSKAVREGRRKEFGRSGDFADPEKAAEIPDPTDPQTFEASRLDWAEIERSPHAEAREETRRLLELRRSHVLPLLKSAFLGGSYEMPTPDALDVTWRFDAGALRLVFNTDEPVLQLADMDGWRVLWASEGASFESGGAGLPAWCGTIMVSDRA